MGENPALAVTSTIRAQCSVGESGKVSKSGGSSYDDDDDDDDDGEGEGVLLSRVMGAVSPDH